MILLHLGALIDIIFFIIGIYVILGACGLFLGE